MSKIVNFVTSSVARQLQAIPIRVSSEGDYRTCHLRLRDGQDLPRVLCFEQPLLILNPGSIVPSDIVEALPSPVALPPALAAKLIEAGESGMGYLRFTVCLKDSSELAFLIGNGTPDFLDLPDGIMSDDIVDVLPHSWPKNVVYGQHRGVAPHGICVFALPESAP
jgi:hypothetical protein